MSHVDFTGKPIARETQNEVRHVLFRIRDFGQVYNVCDGTFTSAEATFSISEEFQSVKQALDGDFKKRKTKFNMNLDRTVPFKVKTSRATFRQIIWNLVQAQINNT